MTRKVDNDEPAEGLEALLAEWLPVVAPFVALIATVGAGFVFGPAVAVLVIALSVLFAAIAIFWTSIRALFGETRLTGEDAYALGAPSAEEEQKRAVLRAIKDLEFERGVGKISDEDFKVLMTKYRREAKRLLRALDDKAAPERKRVERLVTEYLAERGLTGGGPTVADDEEPRKPAKGEKAAKKGKAAKAEAIVDEEDEDLDEDELEPDQDADSEDEDDDSDADGDSDDSDDEDDADDADGDSDDSDDEDDADEDSDDADDADEDSDDADDADDDSDADDSDGDDDADDDDRECPECGTFNDDDAAFCKRCGHKLEASA